ncbi:golgi transport complex family protein [Hibiscus syriacus]|uniref:Golgi transport complex family protein n=1 Tax=Hibiscus syriacus TaxID=106335 RepID=A0A6A3CTC2_HIBSY|nr:golgi transport complex family protein [Hibiscus syriacus]
MIACFIQAIYLLELDRQESIPKETALAPNWWMTFKYKLARTLIDERNGSIFGAVLEWDQSAALVDFVLVRPSGAPKAVLALRGTLLKRPTIRRDVEDDLRFIAWYGSNNVCVAGHSLGVGFTLQVGKALAKEGIYVDAHLFNPPFISLAMSLRNIGEKAGFAWKQLKSMLPSSSVPQAKIISVSTTLIQKELRKKMRKFVLWICTLAKLFVMSKPWKQKFIEAHGLEQWWSDELDLQLALNKSKLISRQLKSLYKENSDDEMDEKVKKYLRGEAANMEGLKDKKLKGQLAWLLPIEGGYLEAEGIEKTWRIKQESISREVDILSSRNQYDIVLPELGPYTLDFTSNDRYMVASGRKGHLAIVDMKTLNLIKEIQVRETVRDAAYLHK